MKRLKFGEERITYALREHETGAPAADICSQLSVSDAMIPVVFFKCFRLNAE